MRRRTGDRARAEQVLQMLKATIATWTRTDQIRSELPPRFRSMVPPSRLSVVRGILSKLMRRGLVRSSSGVDGLGYLPVLAGLVIVGGAASVIAIAAAFPAVQREFTRGRVAEHRAQAARALFLQETRQAARVGPGAAREMAARRADEVARFVSGQADAGGDAVGTQALFSLKDVELPDVGADSPPWLQSLRDVFAGPYKWAALGAGGVLVYSLLQKKGRR